MVDRRQAGSGQMRRGGRESSSAPRSSTPSLSALGAAVLYRWKGTADYVTLNGSNVSALANIDADGVAVGSGNMTQGTGSAQPAFHASGGPNDKPYLEIQDANRSLVATISIAAGNRACIYIIASPTNTNGFTVYTMIHTSGEQTRLTTQTNGYQHRCAFTGGTNSVSITSPANDEGWHLFANRPLATGALSQIDGATTTNNYANSNTLTEASSMRIGSGGVGAVGGVAELIVVDSATSDLDTIIKTYVAAEYALTMA